ncbi:MAG TPA: ATP-binding protein, partial [Anaeromyxobacter sp.]
PGEAPTLIIRPVAELGEGALLRVKEDALAAHRERGAAVDEARLHVRVVGRGEGARVTAFASRLTLPVQLGGAAAGVVLVESAAPEAFGESDARVLDVLVNEVADALRALALRLAGERERIERVVECMADGLLYAATGADEIVANPAARRLLGAPMEGPLAAAWVKDALGFYPFDLVRGQIAARGGAYVVEEVRIGDRTLASTVSPVVERTGRLAGVAVALRDVTEQKHLEERKEEFVHVVSHELRTPLTSITGALDLVLGGLAGEIAPKQARYLQMARDSSEKLNAMVDDLLDVARLAKGKLRMELAVVFLDELVRSTAERYEPAAAEGGHEIEIEAAPAVRIVADATRLGQVLSNLLTNAVKFTPDNGVIRLRVIRAPALPGVAGVTVWNGGEGIPESDLERIFEKFEQARSDKTRRVRGTGLGLAISRGIVEAHGGTIWAESSPGEGARFLVVLPEEPPAESPERAPLGADAPVAVVVDEPDASALACGVLRGAGIACHRAATAEDALALARRHRPRLVVWDPLLPALKGLPLSEILRHDADTRRAAVLAFSAAEGR